MAQADTQPLPIPIVAANIGTETGTPTPTPAPTRRNPASIRSVVVYLRTAQAGSDGQRILQRQRTELQAEIDFQGWKVAAWIEDAHQSGTTTDRPGLQEVLTVLASGYVDALLCTDISRLTRSATVTLLLADHMAACGWDILTLATGSQPIIPVINLGLFLDATTKTTTAAGTDELRGA